MDTTIFFDADIVCPICKHEFKTAKTKTKIKENMPIGYESYLVPIYPNELSNPMSYEVNVCPNCLYSAFHSDFSKEKKGNISLAYKEELKELSKGYSFNNVYTNYELARIKYAMAAFLYEREKERDLIKLGKCYIRIAWYSKELKEIDFYRTALKKALDTYVEAYNAIDEFVMNATIVYLISSIYIEIGSYDSAIPYVNKLNSDNEAKSIPAIKAKLEELTSALRERMKEISEETAGMTDDEKKRAKAARIEASKTKPYKEPFGIEFREPSIQLLGERAVKAKSEEEVNYGIKLTGKKKLLIVDDSLVIRNTLKNMMEGECDIVGMATNGSEAILMYQELKPDYITLDLEMPGINGIETLKKLRNLDKELKVIIVSSNSDSKTVIECLKNGAAGYVLKPISKEKIIEIMNKKH